MAPLPAPPPLREAWHPVAEESLTPAPGACGGLVVRLITSSVDPSWSFASIAAGPNDAARLHHVGDRIGPWRVGAIEWDRVWLLDGGVRCAATLHEGLRGVDGAIGSGTKDSGLVAAVAPSPAWQVPAEVALGIQKRSETELLIDPRAVDRIFAQGAELLAGTRLDPVQEAGAVVGVELGSIASGSLLDRLGIAPGDVLQALDQQRVDSLEGIIASLRAARTRGALVALLNRGGEPFDLEVEERALAIE